MKKTKKKLKVFIGLIIIVLVAVLGYLIYINFFTKEEVK